MSPNKESMIIDDELPPETKDEMIVDEDEPNPDDQAIRLQRSVRAFLARKNAKLNPLPSGQQTSYGPFLLGNDLPLKTNEINPYKIDGNFLVVGTSMFRSIDIACSLVSHQSNQFTPKVILIDNSKYAFEGWKKIQQFFSTCPLSDPTEFIQDEEKGFLQFVLDECQNVRLDSGFNPLSYFEQFFKKHDLDYVKRVVKSSLFIPQDWGDAKTFKMIKTIYSDRPIIAYHSNIIQFVAPETQIQVLKSIEALQPTLSICTDFHPTFRKPTKTFVIANSNPQEIAKTLSLSDQVKKEFSNQEVANKINRQGP